MERLVVHFRIRQSGISGRVDGKFAGFVVQPVSPVAPRILGKFPSDSEHAGRRQGIFVLPASRAAFNRIFKR